MSKPDDSHGAFTCCAAPRDLGHMDGCPRNEENNPDACDHDAPRRGYYGSKCSACGQDFLARDIR